MKFVAFLFCLCVCIYLVSFTITTGIIWTILNLRQLSPVGVGTLRTITNITATTPGAGEPHHHKHHRHHSRSRWAAPLQTSPPPLPEQVSRNITAIANITMTMWAGVYRVSLSIKCGIPCTCTVPESHDSCVVLVLYRVTWLVCCTRSVPERRDHVCCTRIIPEWRDYVCCTRIVPEWRDSWVVLVVYQSDMTMCVVLVVYPSSVF